MARSPRYTTFRPGELEQKLQELSPSGNPLPHLSLSCASPSALQKHTFPVSFPDGQPGTCHYERRGRIGHVFRFQYRDGIWMPYCSWSRTLNGTAAVIEGMGQAFAADSYRRAIEKEQKEEFERATDPAGSPKTVPASSALSVKTAKLCAGKYAVGQLTQSGHFFLESALYDHIEDANAEWRRRGDTSLIVACCHRRKRCWLLLRYNLLYATYDPRPASPMGRQVRK